MLLLSSTQSPQTLWAEDIDLFLSRDHFCSPSMLTNVEVHVMARSHGAIVSTSALFCCKSCKTSSLAGGSEVSSQKSVRTSAQAVTEFNLEEIVSGGKTNSGRGRRMLLTGSSRLLHSAAHKWSSNLFSKANCRLSWNDINIPSRPTSPCQPPRDPSFYYLFHRRLDHAVSPSTAACYCSGWMFTALVKNLGSILPRSIAEHPEGRACCQRNNSAINKYGMKKKKHIK